MKKFFNLLSNKRSLGGIFLLSCLVFNTYSIQENTGLLKKLTNLENGIQTCFGRVNQTFTANLLGDKSSVYLTQSFQSLTEECLAEGILAVENAFQKELAGVGKQLSNLASNVHWFHEDILSPLSASKLAGRGEGRNVGSRFEKIEITKDEILDAASAYKNGLSASLNNQKNIFYVTATLLAIIMLAEFMSLTRRRITNSLREKEAEAELLDNGGASSVKVGEIIRTSLEQNGLLNCAKLFNNFYNHVLTEKNRPKATLDTFITPVQVKNVSLAANSIDQIWSDDTIGVSAEGTGLVLPVLETSALDNSDLPDVNIEQMSDEVIDLLSEKLFSQGIKLETKIPENLMVKGRTEDVQQALYYLFTFAINSTKSESSQKSISVFSHRLGEVVTFDLNYTGKGFDEKVLKQRAGLESIGGELDLDLKICQSLLDGLDAKVQLDNKIDQRGNISGARVKIIFKSGSLQTAGKLVDLKVGSKKEILASLKNETSVI